MGGELLRLSDFLGSQFDCLSVLLSEDGVLLSAGLRLRPVAMEICRKQAFGLISSLRGVAIEGALRVEAYADSRDFTLNGLRSIVERRTP